MVYAIVVIVFYLTRDRAVGTFRYQARGVIHVFVCDCFDRFGSTGA